MTARTTDVPIDGGDLRVAVWGPDDPAAPTALLVHGITASHISWQAVARALPDVRLIAPDLRGRGRSNELPPGEGMAAHAADLVRVLDHLDVARTVVAGHSMGAFVSLVLAHQHPGRVSRLVLVDGGLPLRVPEGITAEQVSALVLGPAAERLAMTFASPSAYLEYWREHPALAECWGPDVEAYLAYDLVPAGAELRPSTSLEVMRADIADLYEGPTAAEALAALAHPAHLITVPRGLMNDLPGLYAEEYLAELLPEHPRIEHTRLADGNHYSVLLDETLADEVARLIRG